MVLDIINVIEIWYSKIRNFFVHLSYI